MEKVFKQAVKHSFSNAKKDITDIRLDLQILREALLKQNEALLQISDKISLFSRKEGENELKNDKKVEKQVELALKEGSIGNNGVKQTNKQTLNKQLSTENKDLTPLEGDFEEEIKQSSTSFQAIKQTPERKGEKITVYKPTLRTYKESLNKTFSQLSKQELKAFLSLYQLEEREKEASYTLIAEEMGLSEACVRGYMANLLKKGIPLVKIKINNKKVVFCIDKEFKDLNLKNKLINLYYQQDPSQMHLFEAY